MMVYRYFDVKKYVTVSLKHSAIIKVILVGSITTATYYIGHVWLNLFALLLAVAFSLRENWNFLKGIPSFLKRKGTSHKR